MQSADSYYQQLVKRLGALRNGQKNLDFSSGVVWFFGIAIVFLAVAVITEAIMAFSSTIRLTIAILIFLFLSGAVLWFIGRPLYRRLFCPSFPDNINLALRVGRHFSVVRDKLADALQVFAKHKKNTEGYSLDLADASLCVIFEQTRDLDFLAVVDSRSLKKAGRFLAVAFVVVAILFVAFTNDFSNAAVRLLNPQTEFATQANFRMEITPGNARVVKGDEIEITVNILGQAQPRPSLFIRNDESDEFDELKLIRIRDNVYKRTIENIRQGKFYYIKAERQESDEFAIAVLERPLVRHLQTKLVYPTYSKLGSQLLDENVGDISALKGTHARLKLQTNTRIDTARLVFDNGRIQNLNAVGLEASGEFTLRRSGSYHIELVDHRGLENSDPIEYRLSVIEDQQPAVRITFPGQDVDLDKEMLLPLSIEAEDDFGIAKARLGYTILEQGYEETDLSFVELPMKNGTVDKLLLNFTWALSELGLQPEDVVVYFAEVYDNDFVSGAKQARSASYRVRFPSIYELYEEVSETHEETYESLEKMFEETQDLKETLDEVLQKMVRDPELNWEEKQNVTETARAQEAVRQQLEELRDNVDNMIERMDHNELVSQETIEKYRELQSLIEDLLTEELREKIEELQSSMEDLDPKELQEAMENLQANQEDMLKSMERTLNLLKKMQAEQKLDEALRKAQDLLRRQEELNQSASEKTGQQERQKYAQEQNRIQKNTEGLKKALDDLAKKMSGFPDMPQERVQEAQNEMEQSGVTENMQQASQQFQSGQMQGAQKSGRQASKGLQQLAQSLQSAKDELSQKQKQKIMQALKRSSHDLLKLSMQQEKLMKETAGADRNTPGLRQMAESQQNTMSSLGRVAEQLYDLSQSTFFVTPEIGQAMGKALNEMKEALQSLESRNPGKSAGNQGQAMAGLNEAASQIMQSMQGLSGASSGIGFQEMMQRMMGLSQQQQGINQQTQGMGQKSGGMNLQQQAAMQRLAAQQEGVRKSLSQLMKEAGRGSNMLGDLGKVSQDMQDVVTELQRNQVAKRTIDRQKKILSRLLDAQKSMQERDFSRKRKAETGKSYTTRSPSALANRPGQKKELLKNELLKAIKEGYSKEYKELIQKYFEALSAEEVGETN